MSKLYLPESMYDIDPQMSREKLEVFYKNRTSVTGSVIRFNIKNELFLVDLGGGLTATMPLNEATIYPIFRDDGTYSPALYTLVGKKIQAKIIILDDYKIILSRRDNMVEALEVLKNETQIQYATITAFSKLSAFIDMGAGIQGRSYGKDFSPVYFNDINDVGLIIGDCISVTILDFDESLQKFNLSRVKSLPKFDEILDTEDFSVCKVFNALHKQEDPTCYGYYVLIDEGICGILDSKFPLKYGDKVVGKIKKFSDNGPHLSLVSF